MNNEPEYDTGRHGALYWVIQGEINWAHLLKKKRPYLWYPHENDEKRLRTRHIRSCLDFSFRK